MKDFLLEDRLESRLSFDKGEWAIASPNSEFNEKDFPSLL